MEEGGKLSCQLRLAFCAHTTSGEVSRYGPRVPKTISPPPAPSAASIAAASHGHPIRRRKCTNSLYTKLGGGSDGGQVHAISQLDEPMAIKQRSKLRVLADEARTRRPHAEPACETTSYSS